MKTFLVSTELAAGVCFGVALAAFIVGAHAHAQEKDPSYPQTRVWKIAETNNIWIVETAGVCLYLSVGYQEKAIAAVPKTQLPKGAGCQ